MGSKRSPIFKDKGDINECGNSKGISLAMAHTSLQACARPGNMPSRLPPPHTHPCRHTLGQATFHPGCPPPTHSCRHALSQATCHPGCPSGPALGRCAGDSGEAGQPPHTGHTPGTTPRTTPCLRPHRDTMYHTTHHTTCHTTSFIMCHTTYHTMCHTPYWTCSVQAPRATSQVLYNTPQVL